MNFPSGVTPFAGQVEAVRRIVEAFKTGKRYFAFQGPTGSGKSVVAKTVMNEHGTGIVTSPVNTLVTQYANDPKLAPLPEVRGKDNYKCRAFRRPEYEPTCQEAEEAFGWEAHNKKCVDYIAARNAFWAAPQSVTNPHYLFFAPVPEGAAWPRKVLVIDEAHGLERALIEMGRRSIHPKVVAEIGGKLYEFPGKRDKELLDNAAVQAWIEYFADALTHYISSLNNKILAGAGAARSSLLNDKKRLESLRDGIHFTLRCGDWIAWLRTNPRTLQRTLYIAPMSAVRAANKLFHGFDHVLLMSATLGHTRLFLEGLGIKEDEAGVYCAPCEFPPKIRPIIFRPLGSLAKKYGMPGYSAILEATCQVIQDHAEDRGIIHCCSNALRDRMVADLRTRFGARILTHGKKREREEGLENLRASRNGVLCSIAMTEGIDLEYADARFCVFPKVPWGDMDDPYVQARKARDGEWYSNQAMVNIIQGSGRVVRHADDYGATFIFDSSFGRVLREATFPEWWSQALVDQEGKKPPQRVTEPPGLPAIEIEGS
jgi:ATP-dependent DNA helicase DinG